MDVFVLPSRWEGLSLALVEAMGAGRAVVATDVGGNPEVVRDGQTGLLVPPNDAGALADALGALARDRDLRAGLATPPPPMPAPASRSSSTSPARGALPAGPRGARSPARRSAR